MALPFLDTNVLLRHLLQDHPDQSPRATAYLQRIEHGEIDVRTSDIVVFEIVFTLERTYKRSKTSIRDGLTALLDLPGIVLPGKRRIKQALDLYAELNIPFPDAYFAVLMGQLKLTEIVSFDRDFDRIPGITRIEP
jgi:predicted nucleic acid-binding protein